MVTIRNPFDVRDVPDPEGDDVKVFAASVNLGGSLHDLNSVNWGDVRDTDHSSIEGSWSSRWNGKAVDWQVGHGEIRLDEDGVRVFILFNWDNGVKQGLIEAIRDAADRFIGRYLNLDAPEITHPWVGLIVDTTRIDGRYPSGRIDFRR